MIQIQNALCRFPSFTLQIDDFYLKEGSMTALVGLNGSGKTTLFRLLLGLKKPEQGTISLLDPNTGTLPVSVKQQIGVVLADSGFPETLCLSDIARILAAYYPTFDWPYWKVLISKMRLPEHKPLSAFSNGMRAMSKVIAALSHHPRFLLLDEPTAGLDIAARQEIFVLLQEYMMEDGRSILISSHIASDLETLCDDLWMIHDGRLCLHENVDELQEEWGILTLDQAQYEALDKSAVFAHAPFGNTVRVLVSDRQFYQDNYPQYPAAKGSIDDLLLIAADGRKE